MQLRPLLKWHGGKFYLAKRITGYYPRHKIYVEPFAGGLNCLLNKFRAEVEIANDIDPDVINLYKTIIHTRKPFRDIRYDESIFLQAKRSQPHDEVSRAVKFFIVNRMSRDGLGEDFSWSDRERGGRPGDENAWETLIASINDIGDRLRGTVFYNEDFHSIIERYDTPETLFYCDPTYLHETRTHTSTYRYEMSKYDHRRLLARIVDCKGKIIISGYDSDLYNQTLNGWHKVVFDMPNHSAQTKIKERRQEIIWRNFA